ncbi:MAG: RNA methyltransferase [Lachnospiraceae bacterium]|nr:RNA methyltransferase [Lachnospiraceae bacterium]
MITSTSNDRIKQIMKYRKSAKERRKQGVFLVEGIRMFVEIPETWCQEVYMTEDFLERHQEQIPEYLLSKVELVAPHVMEAMTDTKTPQGVISVVSQPTYSIEEVCMQKEDSEPLILALENLQDPGNLGTIVRTAEGAGVTGIVMSRETVDIYNPKVVRATMGSIFRVPFCYVENLTDWIASMNVREVGTYSAHLQGTSFYDFDYQKPTIFCIGNEGNGLTDALSQTTKHKIKIPMMGNVESLNAATAATVLMYEAMRQRNS